MSVNERYLLHTANSQVRLEFEKGLLIAHCDLAYLTSYSI